MKKRISSFYKTLLRYKKLVLLFWVFFTLLGLAFSPLLKWDTSQTIWFLEDDPTFKNYTSFLEKFGPQETLVIGLKSKSKFQDRKEWQLIEELSQFLEQHPDVAQVHSLSTTKILESSSRLIRAIPASPSNITTVRTINPEILNANMNMTLLWARVNQADTPVETSERLYKDTLSFLKTKAAKNTFEEIHYSGPVALTHSFYELSQSESQKAVAIVLLILTLLSVIFLKSFKRTLLCFLVWLVSLSSLALSSVVFGFSLNNLTGILPLILLGMSIADAYHYLVNDSLEQTLFPCFLTSLTTAVGFLSLTVSQLRPLREFGILAAIGVCVAFVFTFSVLPLIKNDKNPATASKNSALSTKLTKLYESVLSNRGVLVVLLGFFIAALMLKPTWKSDSSYLKYFDPSLKIVRDTKIIEEEFKGVVPIEILLVPNTKNHDAEFATVDEIKSLQKLQSFLINNTKVLQTHSLLSFLEKALPHFTDKKPEELNQQALSQILFAIDFVPSSGQTSQWWHRESGTLRLSAQLPIPSVTEYQQITSHIQSWAAKEIPQYKIEFNGVVTLFNLMEGYLFEALSESLLIAFIVVSIIIGFVFRSVFLFLNAVLANAFPLVIVYALLGWLQKQMDVGLVMIGAVTLGLIVDDTIHILSALKQSKEKNTPDMSSLVRILSPKIKAVTFTSLALSLSFLGLAVSDFLPNRHFGLFGGLIVILALVCDLILLPQIHFFLAASIEKN
ncbi:MAG: MMPL family transporter [Deltaproteobacteria bacterium]|nr:MMPL family transporter [Deltaproteobacteria bacterium]